MRERDYESMNLDEVVDLMVKHPRVNITCPERLKEAIEFAKKIDDKTLKTALSRRLNVLDIHIDEKLALHADFSKMSFFFQHMVGDRLGLCGGILCRGIGDEVFSVELEPREGIYWTTNT